jgi:hypothetical protein
MRVGTYARAVVCCISVLVLWAVLVCSPKHSVVVSAAAYGQAAKEPHCTVDLTEDNHHGNAFNFVRAGVSGASYRDYTCSGFKSGAPVKATITGTFKVEDMDVNGKPGGKGAGWIQMTLQFTSPGSPISMYTQCYGNPSGDATICDAWPRKSDPERFEIKEDGKAHDGNWGVRGKNSVSGFADANGKAIVRIEMVRAETIYSGPNVNHPVSATANAILTISSD